MGLMHDDIAALLQHEGAVGLGRINVDYAQSRFLKDKRFATPTAKQIVARIEKIARRQRESILGAHRFVMSNHTFMQTRALADQMNKIARPSDMRYLIETARPPFQNLWVETLELVQPDNPERTARLAWHLQDATKDYDPGAAEPYIWRVAQYYVIGDSSLPMYVPIQMIWSSNPDRPFRSIRPSKYAGPPILSGLTFDLMNTDTMPGERPQYDPSKYTPAHLELDKYYGLEFIDNMGIDMEELKRVEKELDQSRTIPALKVQRDYAEAQAQWLDEVVSLQKNFIHLLDNKDNPDSQFESLQLHEHLNVLINLLAMINVMPIVELSERKERGRGLRKGKTYPFLDYSLINIQIPNKTRYELSAELRKAARTEIHKKRHHVRGHWRHYRAPDGTLLRRVWISDHYRGDAELGFVTHDYHVTTNLETTQ